jgi:GMP synthase-like glutamine amidotransferase
VLVVHNSASGPVARLGDWLTQAGLELHVVDGPHLPPNLDGWAGMVVLGGEMGANDDHIAPWLPHERALLREAVSRQVPTLGVCLGGQLLAAAHGGRVEQSADQSEVGARLIAKRTAASTDPLFGPLPITPDVLQWHYDAITVLPPGAVHLASSPVCDNQAFRLGRLAWGVQFHIETTPELVRSWAAEDAAALDGVDVEQLVSRAVAAHDDIAEVWAPFAHAFAAVVGDPDAVAAARGVPTSTAAPITDPAAIRAALAAEAAASSAARVMLPMPTTGPPTTDGSAYPPRRGDGA